MQPVAANSSQQLTLANLFSSASTFFRKRKNCDVKNQNQPFIIKTNCFTASSIKLSRFPLPLIRSLSAREQ